MEIVFKYTWNWRRKQQQQKKDSLYRTKLGKEEKNIVSPSTVDFAVRGGKLGIYMLHNPLRYS